MRLFVIPIALSLTGCTYWAKPGGTSAEFEATTATCELWSYTQFPLMLEQVQLSPGYIEPLSTVCEPHRSRARCYTTGGMYVAPTYGSVDRNSHARDIGFNVCLRSAGWIPAKSRAEAEAITNSVSGKP